MNNIPQENISAFINHKYKPYDSVKTWLMLFLCWAMTVPLYLVGDNTLPWVIVVAVFNLILTGLCIKERKILKYYGFLIDGVSTAYFGVLFNILAYRLYTFYFSENIVFMLLMLIAFFMTICLSVMVITSLIKTGKFKSASLKKGSSVVIAVLALSLARYTVGENGLFNEYMGIIVVATFLMLSLILGVVSAKSLLKHWLTK